MSTKSSFASCLNCESLEERDNPSGNVSVVVSNNFVFIQGDAFNNSIRVQQDGFGNLLVVSLDDTRVNGQSSIFVGRGSPNGVQISMGAGNDRVEVTGLATFGSLIVGGGAGNDQIVIANTTASNSVEVYGRDGNDITFLTNVFANFMVMDGGNGTDALHFDNTFAPNGFVVLNTETFF
jgi:hypothetical protein